MSATDELRRMLDERGVKWHEATPHKTKWFSPVLNGPVAVSEWRGKLVLDAGYVNVTPEQAIAATLGCGECEDKGGVGSKYPAAFICSECGWFSTVFAFGSDMPQFCPNCGRKVAAS